MNGRGLKLCYNIDNLKPRVHFRINGWYQDRGKKYKIKDFEKHT